MIEWKTETWPISRLKDWPKNPRKFTPKGMDDLKASMTRLGYIDPIAVNTDGTIIGGHARKKMLKELGLKEIDVRVPDRLLTDREIEEAAVRLNKNVAGMWDFEALANGFDSQDLIEWGFEAEELGLAEVPEGGGEENAGALSGRFLVPPFSVLNAREGWWQERKNQWLALGVESELGREAGLLDMSKTVGRLKPKAEKGGTSVFDPVLCELVYRWFSPQGGTVVDPFAGGSVRGIVASKLGRQYLGSDLRKEQVEANRAQAQEICREDAAQPAWHCGDSRLIDRTLEGVEADLVFSCPPYVGLEVYSDDSRDLSTMKYDGFRESYREIIAKACGLLKPDRFACFVVGEVRDKKGNYFDFVGDTVQAFRDAGLAYYNEAILVTQAGSLPIRAGKAFGSSRKLGKTHQNVLVFVKGDPKIAAGACGEVDLDDSFFAEAEPLD